MAAPLRMLMVSGLIWALAGCQNALFATFNAFAPGRDAVVESGRVFDAGNDLRADVYLPNARSDSTPVVVFFYGGSWRNGSRSWYRFIGERLASHGVIAVIPDYRRYPQVRFPVFVEDAARAVVWSGREYAGRGRPLFIAGHSAGAHIAALVGTDGRYLAGAGGSLERIAGVVGYSGVYDFLPLTDDTLKATFGDPARWKDSQPVNFVDGDEPPFLLVHGRNDRLVWPVNSESLARALRTHAVPVELLLRDDLGHYASAFNFARRAGDPNTRALLAFLRDPPSRTSRIARSHAVPFDLIAGRSDRGS